MYLVLYCHNIGQTEFSFFESDDLDRDNGYIVRGKWPNEQAFRAYLQSEFGDMAGYKVIDLVSKGKAAEAYNQADLIQISQQISL